MFQYIKNKKIFIRFFDSIDYCVLVMNKKLPFNKLDYVKFYIIINSLLNNCRATFIFCKLIISRAAIVLAVVNIYLFRSVRSSIKIIRKKGKILFEE